ncbi:MAG: metallopeptidase family protein [Bryobacteraceae bacterium]|nr:metallopeptidase family protein [Bryobacteraceae bacterium]
MSLSKASFEELVADAFASIPAAYRARMRNVVLVVEDQAPSPGLLGLYEGRPLTERQASDGFVLPDRITIYRIPHVRQARNVQHLRRLVAETVWHEIAHYFGLDEAQVLRAERARTRRRYAR